ncbi:pyrroline-5-carboxylate reductase [Paenibacillus tianmuensis]|uniref:Pyrroline-5-carboxylate reductase n=1 Tax=Paenibacillus tianmuensis TaxID=624147 RepID=A0A1G4QY83_9BACL|nr:pyrroline-5-carboxylate reductase [Paenibacillus tianmuensis]SCW49361.1 pyrroline-5-carboxylate reductase [Paenibacillus tianmuensis]
MSQILSKNITFVGAGSMAEAIIRGLVSEAGMETGQLVAVNRSNEARLQQLNKQYGIRYAAGAAERNEAISSADIVVLAFKPSDAAQGILDLKPVLRKEQLLVSVIAGLSIETMEAILGSPGWAIVRTMPNTSSTIGLGATGLSFSVGVSDAQRQLGEEMFRSIGIVSIVEEPLLETIVSLSGCGPAYIYYMMEAMIESGMNGGLTHEEAKRLTVQTVLGAARMVELSGEEPAELRRKVTSPNGATHAAIETMYNCGFTDAISKGMRRAAERSAEMGAAISASIASHTK